MTEKKKEIMGSTKEYLSSNYKYFYIVPFLQCNLDPSSRFAQNNLEGLG